MSHFVSVPPEDLLLSQVIKAKNSLIEGLESVQQSDGWDDPTYEKAQYLWTSVEVCTTLLRAKSKLLNLDLFVNSVIQSKITKSGMIGWESEGSETLISTFVTRDVGALFLELGLIDHLEEVIDTLEKLQNSDGGWGVFDGDKQSRTRATSFVLSFLCECLHSPLATSKVNKAILINGLKWLYSAQTNSGGWANIADSPPDNISATAIALDALLSAALLKAKTNDIDIPVRDQLINTGLARLDQLCREQGFRGHREEFSVRINNSLYKHIAGGLGATVIGTVLSKAVLLQFLDCNNPLLIDCFSDIISRTQNYPPHKGSWVVPSDANSSPVAWNSAFAIDAILCFEQAYKYLLSNGFLEKSFLHHLQNQVTLWRRISILLISCILAFLLLNSLSLFPEIASWFNEQTPLSQGFIMIFITIFVERSFTIATRMLSSMIRIRK